MRPEAFTEVQIGIIYKTWNSVVWYMVTSNLGEIFYPELEAGFPYEILVTSLPTKHPVP
jgi:hypothetical protein